MIIVFIQNYISSLPCFTVLIFKHFSLQIRYKHIIYELTVYKTSSLKLRIATFWVFFRRLPMCGQRGTFWWRLTTSGWSKCTTPSRISRIFTSSWSSSLEVSPSSYMYILVLGTVPLIYMGIARQLVNTI